MEDTNTVIVLNHTSSSLNYSIIREIQQVLDDSTSTDLTHEVVATILDDGIESAVECYFNRNLAGKIVLDTLKIAEASKLLYDTNYPSTAQELMLFKDMYVKGELDTNFLTDKKFLESLSVKSY